MFLWIVGESTLRLWSAGCRSRYQGFSGRIKFMRRPQCLIGRCTLGTSPWLLSELLFGLLNSNFITYLHISYFSADHLNWAKFLFGLILRDIPNTITPQTSDCSYSLVPASAGGPPYSLPHCFHVTDRGTGEGRYLCP